MKFRGGPDIDDINDIRNGLLLFQSLHTVIGLGEAAFLRVGLFKLLLDRRIGLII